ncbi:efflux RND transporter periplasmic adaptor subunit [Cupriavidus pauculus]|uniref:Efflux RND transporter periplasmic adaptor subunit n=1 Tax=Cupriavidus pauculus TaxID=82633 RepID=A0A2N5CAX6_9BURK|nr:efflux RND transporter periplasmic adaptor subunit [Cupriavidus pauculus]PLP99380.1 efflux RND transporter periplasmic adaptor subunit [Cupriavidus pauculus]
MNARLKVAVTCLIMVGAAGYGGYRLGSLHQIQTLSEAGNQAKAGDIDPKTGKKILYWHDPMVPGQRFDKPGKSPFMDMQLVPVYADGDGPDGGNSGVTIDSHVAQNLGIRTVEVKAARMGTVLEAPGNVAIDERSIQVVQARTTGFVQHVGVRATLDTVRRGQILVDLYSPDWIAAQEEYLAVARLPSGTQGDLASAARARMLQSGMTPAQADAVVRSGKLQSGQGIASPLDGVVTEIGVREGMTVTPGTTLFRLADLGQVWVIAEVPEAQTRLVAPGQTVTVSATGVPEPVAGKIDAILPDVNAATRTVKVRVILPNKQRRLMPGMFASIRFESNDREDVLQIPSEAVIHAGQRNLVMMDAGQQGYVPTEIRIGRESEGMVEVVSGLKPGQKVVASGQFLIDSDASLRGTLSRMAPAGDVSASAAAVQEHEGTGRVESVNPDGLTISHGPIPSTKWGAMTMDFGTNDPALLKGVKPGDRIRFHFRLDQDGVATLSAVQPAEKPATAGGGK